MQEISGGIGNVPGFKSAGISCGIKKNGKKDLALIYSEKPAAAAGIFTTSRVKAAPVLYCQGILPSKQIHVVLINSGNANACTGKQGMDNILYLTEVLAGHLKVSDKTVLMCSTGVIGAPLPVDKIETAIPALLQNLKSGDNPAPAEAIITTDLTIKQAAVRLNIQGREITIGGMAKGSGMICPNMATMLAFVATDAQIKTGVMQDALQAAADKSFNRITVDGDMSTNDTLLLLANGASQVTLSPADPDWPLFCAGLDLVCERLAQLIIRDGEGATKVIEIRVEQAASREGALRIAYQIANSNLVKTALFAADANWGRIMGAAGAANVDFDQHKVDLWIGEILLVENGVGRGKEVENQVHEILKKADVLIRVVLHQGDKQATVWGNDLSYDYVRINVDYRS
ncbi:MAG: bifunctional glutamate N-acetyltransferase/amino-acid acetyltransferase ArgJ [Candidatus Schekmanbacteria bacterium]|nr:bifunctional glutamate N-acetyltransferase/amino-acid acetyltransferase ArgJ [Candidatus Schekmanbacteria bacterium]